MTQKTVLWWGRFGPDYSRNRVAIALFKELGWKVEIFLVRWCCALGDVEFALQFGTVFEDQAGHLVGGAHRRSRFNDKQVAFLEQGDDRAGGSLHVRDVRLVIAFEGGGYDDQVNVAHYRGGGGAQAAFGDGLMYDLPQSGFDDVDFPAVDGFHHSGVDVHAGYLQSPAGGYGGRGQPDVSQS